MSDHLSVLLVGAGYMGKEYYKVLMAQGIQPVVVCRSKATAEKFGNEMNAKAYTGGLTEALRQLDAIPEKAIVAVNADQLMITTVGLIEKGVKDILVEKPAGLNRVEIEKVCEAAEKAGTHVYVAYNRRFYASTEKALEIIKADGGVSSFNFEFTEWSFSVKNTSHPAHVKEEWLLANSSHVIDLAFFLGGFPVEMTTYHGGSLSWHSRGSKYVGAGRTEAGVLFSYQANWDAPGRWAVEILTSEHRLYFKPMEKLAMQSKASVRVEDVVIDDELDVKFKPGLYKQTAAFLSGTTDSRLLTIQGQKRNLDFYEQMER